MIKNSFLVIKRYKTIRWGKDLQVWIVEGQNTEVQIILRMDQIKQFGGNIKKNGSMKQLKNQMQLYKFWLHPHQFLIQIRLEKMIT